MLTNEEVKDAVSKIKNGETVSFWVWFEQEPTEMEFNDVGFETLCVSFVSKSKMIEGKPLRVNAKHCFSSLAHLATAEAVSAWRECKSLRTFVNEEFKTIDILQDRKNVSLERRIKRLEIHAKYSRMADYVTIGGLAVMIVLCLFSLVF